MNDDERDDLIRQGFTAEQANEFLVQRPQWTGRGIDCTCTIGWSSAKEAEFGDPTGLDPDCPIHSTDGGTPQ